MKKRKTVSLCLAFTMFLGCLGAPALADHGAEVEDANSLSVYLQGAGNEQVLLHTYSVSEMEALTNGEEIYYSSIDAMPTTVLTVATGVYIEDLICDLAQYTENDLTQTTKMQMTASDGWTRTYALEDLFQTRYYYEGLFYATLTNGKADPDEVGEGVEVRPMLAVDIWQNRVPLDSSGYGDGESGVSGVRFCFCAGMLPGDLTSGYSTTASYGRGIDTVVLKTNQSVEPPYVSVTGLTLDKETATIQSGRTVQLTAKTIPQEATNSDVHWSSSKTSVATVTEDGLVKGISPGTATITAVSDENEAYVKSCVVTVTQETKPTPTPTPTPTDTGTIEVPVKGIALSPQTMALKLNEKGTVVATVYPSNASNQTVYFSSSAPGVVQVDTQGGVTAKAEGTAVITAMTEDMGFTAACTITVTKETEPSPPIPAFPDIETSWAKESIERAAALGVVNGKPDGTFDPNGTLTRAEFVAMLLRTLEEVQTVPMEASVAFTDTKGHWAENEISVAVSMGLASGYGNGKFGPDDSITREQLAVMLQKAWNLSKGGQINFTDGTSISAWAKDAVAAAVGAGLFTGYQDGSFRPQAKATRAEATVLLLRALDDARSR